MMAARRGADRQEMHELLREHALGAWAVVQAGMPNDLIARLQADESIIRLVPAEEIAALARVDGYVGNAPSGQGNWQKPSALPVGSRSFLVPQETADT